MFINRLKSLLEEKQITRKQFLEDLGFGKNNFTRWEKGTIPNRSAIKVISDYFGVSEQYLLGKTDIKGKDLTRIGEAEEGYYLIANRSKDGKQGTERLTKSEYEALMAVIKTLRHNTDEEL